MKISNILTISRLILAPIIMVLILFRIWAVAIALLAIAFATDILDGYLARKLKQESKLGKVLDPIADKTLALLVFKGLFVALRKPEVLGNVIYGFMFFSKDLISFFLLVCTKSVKVKKVHARLLGKVTTVAQAVTLFWVILKLPHFELWIYLVFILGIAAGIDYYLRFRRKSR